MEKLVDVASQLAGFICELQLRIHALDDDFQSDRRFHWQTTISSMGL